VEYLVFAAGAVVFGLFLLWCIIDAGLDARTHARNEATSGDATTTEHDEVVAATAK